MVYILGGYITLLVVSGLLLLHDFCYGHKWEYYHHQTLRVCKKCGTAHSWGSFTDLNKKGGLYVEIIGPSRGKERCLNLLEKLFQ